MYMTRPAREIPTDPAQPIRKKCVYITNTHRLQEKRRTEENENFYHLKTVFQYLELITSGIHTEHIKGVQETGKLIKNYLDMIG